MKLKDKKCLPCEAQTPSLSQNQIRKLLKQLPHGWKQIGYKKIAKEFGFRSYPETIGFVNRVALIAQEAGHHPDLHVSYSKVVVELSTHAINGLSENDFILAAKIEF